MNDDNNLDYPGRGGRIFGPGPGSPPPQIRVRYRRKPRKQSPQRIVDQYWGKLNSKYPGKILNVLPDNPYVQRKAATTPRGTIHGQEEAKSYEKAFAECERDVDRIIRECKRTNQKYRDPHFDIEFDLKTGQRNCLDGLSKCSEGMKPKGVKRVSDIFNDPHFYINGPTAGDVRQGRDGDCYLMAALCGLGNMNRLINKICVKYDQDVGVYGFLFFRDGEWQQTIVDDKLYLRAPDYDEAQHERIIWDDINRIDPAEEYRKTHQTGSRALYFAQCSEENETWLPLLEKAYAKAHGDFSSIDGGFTGEAIEDLTGGVTSEFYSTDILDKEKFWNEELMQVGKTFLFGCATGFLSSWLDTTGQNAPREREGISEGHAYSIMEAREIKGKCLLKLRNPWGRKEWDGRWSDGSAEWTTEWMQLLEHKFGNDGIFWISYEDLLKKYQHFDRTRIFGPDWNVTQCWTSVDVAWSAEYHSTKFSLTLKEKGPVVIVLSQLDETYYGGLEGGYTFDLQFRLEDDSRADRNDYILRSNSPYAMARSVSSDTELDAGIYSVRIKLTATRDFNYSLIEDVLPAYAATRREKLIQMGRSYDLAHAKGVTLESREEKKKRKAKQKAKKIRDREKLKEVLKEDAMKHWERERRRHDRIQQRKLRREQAAATQRESKNRSAKEANGGDQLRRRDTSDSMVVQDSASIKSLDSRPVLDDEPTTTNSGEAMTNNSEKTNSTFRIKSFSGEIVSIDSTAAAAYNKSGAPLSDQPTSEDDPEANVKQKNSVLSDIVQPLEDVIHQADQESQSNGAQQQTGDEDGTDQVEELPPPPVIQVNGVDVVTDVRPLPALPHVSKAAVDAGPDHNTQHQLTTKSDHTVTILDGDTTTLPESDDVADEPSTNSRPHDQLPSNTTHPRMRTARRPNQSSQGSVYQSDSDTFPPFDWDSELDMPTESDSPPSASSTASSNNSSDSEGDLYHGFEAQRRQQQSRGRGRRDIDHRRGRLRSNSPRPQPVDGIINDRGPPGDGQDSDGPADPWNAVCVIGLRVYSTLPANQLTLKVVNTRRGNNRRQHQHHTKVRTPTGPTPSQSAATNNGKSRSNTNNNYAIVDNERVIMPGDDVLYHEDDRRFDTFVGEDVDANGQDILLDEPALDPDDMNRGAVVAADMDIPSPSASVEASNSNIRTRLSNQWNQTRKPVLKTQSQSQPQNQQKYNPRRRRG